MDKVVFLDRDGTINEEVNYLFRLEDLKLIEGTAKAIESLNRSGYKVAVVSNQAGVARGYYTKQDVDKLHRYLNERLQESNAHIDSFFYCPHHPEHGIGEFKMKCNCRKPALGMFLEAEKYFQVDKTISWMIGDNYGDIKAAMDYGLKSILVRTGHGETVFKDKNNGLIYETCSQNLSEAVDYILRNQTPQTNSHF